MTIKPDDLDGQADYRKQLLNNLTKYTDRSDNGLANTYPGTPAGYEQYLETAKKELDEFTAWQLKTDRLRQQNRGNTVTLEEGHASQLQKLKNVLESHKLELRNPNMQSKDTDVKPKLKRFNTPFPDRYMQQDKSGKFTDRYWGAKQDDKVSGTVPKPII